MTPYQKASTDWFASCTVGISAHWTAQTVPRSGVAESFADAVDSFRLEEFLGAVEKSGADYVIFTSTHALQMFPCPNAVVDGILPGRTSKRDLIGEIARGLDKIGKPLIVYYNHSCNKGQDPAWEQAVGYHDDSKDRLAENLCDIVQWMGERYGRLVRGWWFDSSYSLDPSGPHDFTSTDMTGWRFPWEKMTIAAKAGYADRLVTYNAGINQTFLYTDHQDYWAGEILRLPPKTPPTSRFMKNGLQWHGWTCLDDRQWVYTDNSKEPNPPLYGDDEILGFLLKCRKHEAPMTCNVICFQDGTLAEASVRQLNRVTKEMR